MPSSLFGCSCSLSSFYLFCGCMWLSTTIHTQTYSFLYIHRHTYLFLSTKPKSQTKADRSYIHKLMKFFCVSSLQQLFCFFFILFFIFVHIINNKSWFCFWFLFHFISCALILLIGSLCRTNVDNPQFLEGILPTLYTIYRLKAIYSSFYFIAKFIRSKW